MTERSSSFWTTLNPCLHQSLWSSHSLCLKCSVLQVFSNGWSVSLTGSQPKKLPSVISSSKVDMHIHVLCTPGIGVSHYNLNRQPSFPCPPALFSSTFIRTCSICLSTMSLVISGTWSKAQHIGFYFLKFIKYVLNFSLLSTVQKPTWLNSSHEIEWSNMLS